MFSNQKKNARYSQPSTVLIKWSISIPALKATWRRNDNLGFYVTNRKNFIKVYRPHVTSKAREKEGVRQSPSNWSTVIFKM